MQTTFPVPPSFAALQAAVGEVCAGLPVARIEVFGSVARGEAREGSDVDLMVEFLPGAGAGLFEMGALKEDLEEKIGCRVDLLSRRAVEQSRNQYRRRAILSNPVTVYAR
jgi:predicted nucleotidyltransferase